jgi:hypothetical protein
MSSDGELSEALQLSDEQKIRPRDVREQLMYYQGQREQGCTEWDIRLSGTAFAQMGNRGLAKCFALVTLVPGFWSDAP